MTALADEYKAINLSQGFPDFAQQFVERLPVVAGLGGKRGEECLHGDFF